MQLIKKQKNEFECPKKTNVITAITTFLSADLLQEEIQQLPQDLQEIFDMVLDTSYGNDIKTRRKMLRLKELLTSFAKIVEPFPEAEIQESCKAYHNIN